VPSGFRTDLVRDPDGRPLRGLARDPVRAANSGVERLASIPPRHQRLRGGRERRESGEQLLAERPGRGRTREAEELAMERLEPPGGARDLLARARVTGVEVVAQAGADRVELDLHLVRGGIGRFHDPRQPAHGRAHRLQPVVDDRQAPQPDDEDDREAEDDLPGHAQAHAAGG
jgi:hypothetical protein